jgi:hypothetical protein
MKVKSWSVLMLAAVAFMTMGLSVSPLQASQYLGTFNWQASITQTDQGPVDPPQTFTVQVALSRVTTGYYLTQGLVNPPDDYPYVLNGGGVVVTNQGNSVMVLTMSSSQEHTTSWRDTGVMNVRVNPTTFNGSFYEVRTDIDASAASNPFSQAYSLGTLTLQGPPPPLTSMPPVSLLLD